MKKHYFCLRAALLMLTLAMAGASYSGEATLIPSGSVWKYLDNGTNQDTAWRMSTFDDAAWASGAAQLGYGDGDETTVVSFGSNSSNKHITTYFRKTFNVQNASILKSLLIALVADDGAVVYVNGQEAFRHNMQAGAISHTTAANVTVGGHFESLNFYFDVPVAMLITGINTIAVEVHQDSPTSSDVSFNLQLSVSTEKTIIARGDVWKYLDNGSNQGTSWKDTTFNDGSWAQGKSVLGYNSTAASRIENTAISWGANSSNKYPTAYFRKTISIADTSSFGDLTARVFIDDGYILYINGTEAARGNMPTGAVTFSTFANVTVNGTGVWLTATIDKSLLRNGTNVFAVEGHQVNATSSDHVFELEIKETPTPPAVGGGCSTATIGCFTSVSPSCQAGTLIIPSTHTFQYIMAQGDAYQTGGGNMPTNNDFTGYVPLNGSSEQGYLAVNHENNPGGVSILDISFNPYTGLWSRDNSKAVSFTPVVKTERNCSGGITPWGTVVTCEETFTTGDANGDGFVDVGWHVEIDPISATIMSHNSNGTPDKLWAMGRGSKENIAFKSDSLTSYFGLDDGTYGYLYKFVADSVTDLGSGTLYVLLQSVLGSANANWVQVPNTTQSDLNNSRGVANGLGARNYNRIEDVEIGPDGKIYFVSTATGNIYRFTDAATNITDFEVFIQGNTSYTMNNGSGAVSATFEWGDNLAFDPDGNLWVNQDGTCGYIWMIRPNHTSISPQIEVFARTPSSSESTGQTFSPDGRFMFLSIQHPSSSLNTPTTDAAGNDVIFNKATTIVIGRKEDLGPLAAIPFIDLGSDTTVCTGSLVLDAGNSGASFLWNTGATTQTIEPSATGIYSVTVTGTNGNSNSASVNVTVISLPTSPEAASTEYCFGEPVNALQAIGNNVKWYSDSTLNTLLDTGNALNTGVSAVGNYSYYATQTNSFGCESSATIANIVINPVPAAPSVEGAVSCEGTNVASLQASGNDLTWYSNAALTTAVGSGGSFNTGNTSAGTYVYYVTETNEFGCEGAASADTLTINPQPTAPTASDEAVCAGEVVPELEATGNNVLWFTDTTLNNQVNSGNSFATGNVAVGVYTYYATQTNGFGCSSVSSQATLTIHALPVAPVAISVSVCEEQTVADLEAVGANIAWYAESQLNTLLDSGSSYSAGEVTPGTYSYFATQTDSNSCESAPTEVSLVIFELPGTPASNNAEVCHLQSVPDLSAIGENLRWYDDSALTNLLDSGVNFATGNTAPGLYTYFVTQTNNDQCVSHPAEVSLLIRALPSSPVVSGKTEYCEGEPVEALNATGNNVFWYSDPLLSTIVGGSNLFTPTISATSSIYVTQQDAFCESQSTTVTITINSLPVVVINPLALTYLNTEFPITLSGTPFGGNFSGTGVVGNTFDPALAGIGGPYTITYAYTESSTGCSNTDETSTSVDENVGVAVLANGSSVSVYPNPTSDVLNIKLDLRESENVEVRLTDANGREILVYPVSEMSTGKNEISVEKSKLNLSNGTYWLTLEAGDSHYVLPVVFQ